MKEKIYPSLAEIKASHAPKVEYERYLLASRFIFRPPSFPAIWLLVRLGLTGEGASWLSGLSALLGYICLLWPAGPQLWPAVAFLLLFNFFDCLDGGIARITNARNSYGRFLDSIMWWADMLFWLLIGVTIWRMPALRSAGEALGLQPGLWLAAGALCAFLADYAAYLDSTYDQALRGPWEKLMAEQGVHPAATPTAGKSWPEVLARALVHNLRVRETHYLLIIPAFALGAGDILLTVFTVFNATLVAALLISYCRRGRKIREAELSGR